MEFFEGFRWAVPKAFRDALASCSFAEGDMLYSTQAAYAEAWDEGQVEYAIRIHAPTRKPQASESVESASMFEANWNSPVKLEFFKGAAPFSSERFLFSSQGRLFTLLRYGDLSVLDTTSPPPPVPLLLGQLRSYLDASDVHDAVRNMIQARAQKPTLALIPFDAASNQSAEKYRRLQRAIKEFDPQELDIPFANLPGFEALDFHPALSLKGALVDSGASEKVRDVLKAAFWLRRESRNATKSFCDVVQRTRSVGPAHFRLANHLAFLPYQNRRFNTIRVHSFAHKPVYRYRLHTERMDAPASNVPKGLSNFLGLLFEDCPNHLFNESDLRVSKLHFNVEVELDHTRNHELIELACASEGFAPFQSRHENLEQYFLEHDEPTIAAEIPVWIEEGDLNDYREVFETREPLTGHIDLLRMEPDGRIAILDYKPHARAEKKAHEQLFLYALMLSVRTGIKMSNFVCAYFDESNYYRFEPSEVSVEQCHRKR